MKNIIMTAALLQLPLAAFAGGHSAQSGHGTGVTVDTKTIEAVSGVDFQQTTNDVWLYVNP